MNYVKSHLIRQSEKYISYISNYLNFKPPAEMQRVRRVFPQKLYGVVELLLNNLEQIPQFRGFLAYGLGARGGIGDNICLDNILNICLSIGRDTTGLSPPLSPKPKASSLNSSQPYPQKTREKCPLPSKTCEKKYSAGPLRLCGVISPPMATYSPDDFLQRQPPIPITI